MKLYFSLFGIEVSMNVRGYEICVASVRCGDPYGDQAWFFAATLLGARFKAWRLARLYAKVELVDQNIFIWSGTRATRDESPIVVRRLRIKHSVPLFTE